MSCRDTNSGPVYQVEVNEQWPYIDLGPDKADSNGNIVVIGDGVTIPQRQGQNNYCFRVRGPGPICTDGITVHNSTDLQLGWNDRYRLGNSASILFRNGDVRVENFRVFNGWDAFRPERREQSTLRYHLKSGWVTHNRDDFDENDWTHDGIHEDLLVDGTYIYLSSTGGAKGTGKEKTLVKDCIIRMQRMPGPDGHREKDSKGAYKTSACGRLLKYDNSSPPVEWQNVIIYWEWIASNPSGESSWIANAPNQMGFRHKNGQCIKCTNVTVIWPDEAAARWGSWEDLVGEMPEGVTVTNDVSIYENARAQWIQNHQHLMKIENDPITTRLKSDGFTEVVPIELGEVQPPEPLGPFTVNVTGISHDRAVFNFTAGQETTGETWLGLSPDNLERVKNETGYYPEHRQHVSGMAPATLYYYQCGGCNRANSCNRSEIGSFWTLNEDGTPVDPPTEPPVEPPVEPPIEPEPGPTGGLSWPAKDAQGNEFTVTIKAKNGQ